MSEMKKIPFGVKAALASESYDTVKEIAVYSEKGIPMECENNADKIVIMQVTDNGDGTFSPKFVEVVQ